MLIDPSGQRFVEDGCTKGHIICHVPVTRDGHSIPIRGPGIGIIQVYPDVGDLFGDHDWSIAEVSLEID